MYILCRMYVFLYIKDILRPLRVSCFCCESEDIKVERGICLKVTCSLLDRSFVVVGKH